MNFRNYICALLLLICGAATSFAQQRLTLSECREMALENNFEIKSSVEKIASAEDMLAAYRRNNLPNLSASLNYLYTSAGFTQTISGGYLPTFVPDPATGELKPNDVGKDANGEYIFGEYAYMPDMKFDVEFGSMFGGSALLTQPIYMGGKISSAIKLARVGVSAAEFSKRLTEAEVLLAVDEAYYSLIKVQEMLLAAEKYKAVVEEFLRQITNAQQSGMATRNDQMKVEVRKNEAELLLQRAQNGVRLARMNLCYMVGLPLATLDLQVVDEFDMTSQVVSNELDITSRPEYALLEQQIEAKELESKITRSEFLPSVVALGSAGYTNGIKINDAPLLNDATLSAGVMVNVPIFHWGEGRRKSSAARREVVIARNQFEDLSQKMTLELMQAINRYEESISEVELMTLSVAQAEENMRLSSGSYRSGMETIADYLESQALWQSAMSDLVEAKASQRVAYSKYQKACGKL